MPLSDSDAALIAGLWDLLRRVMGMRRSGCARVIAQLRGTAATPGMGMWTGASYPWTNKRER